MWDGMARAWLTVGAVAFICLGALAALQQASPRLATHAVTAQPAQDRTRVATAVPVSLRANHDEDLRVEERRREAAAREATRRQDGERQRAESKEIQRAKQSRLAAERTVEAVRLAKVQREAEAQRIANKQMEADRSRAAGKRRAIEAQQLADNQRVSESVRSVDFWVRRNQPTEVPVTRVPAHAPERLERPWNRRQLIPGMVLHIQTNGRPCTVWTDTPMDIFPNNPSLAHRVVEAGRELHFPLQRGRGPESIHARPIGGTSGTIAVRFDD